MTRAIRMFPDSGAAWPFWETGSGPIQPTPTELGLSEGVATLLREWVQFWRDHCELNLAWDSSENLETFLRKGDELRELVVAELGDDFRVQLLPGISGTGDQAPPTHSVGARPSRTGAGVWAMPPSRS